MTATFDEKVWAVVAAIPPGQVMSYGEVAKAAGFPRHARMVSRAMVRSVRKIPWHRVVRSDRTLAFPAGSEYFETQKTLLESEGVVLLSGKIVKTNPQKTDDLDALIWGPD